MKQKYRSYCEIFNFLDYLGAFEAWKHDFGVTCMKCDVKVLWHMLNINTSMSEMVMIETSLVLSQKHENSVNIINQKNKTWCLLRIFACFQNGLPWNLPQLFELLFFTGRNHHLIIWLVSCSQLSGNMPKKQKWKQKMEKFCKGTLLGAINMVITCHAI